MNTFTVPIMIKNIYPGPIVSYIIGVFGVGLSMSNIDPVFKYSIATVSMVILIITAAIKFEDYLALRAKRQKRENIDVVERFIDILDERDIENVDKDSVHEIKDLID